MICYVHAESRKSVGAPRLIDFVTDNIANFRKRGALQLLRFHAASSMQLHRGLIDCNCSDSGGKNSAGDKGELTLKSLLGAGALFCNIVALTAFFPRNVGQNYVPPQKWVGNFCGKYNESGLRILKCFQTVELVVALLPRILLPTFLLHPFAIAFSAHQMCITIAGVEYWMNEAENEMPTNTRWMGKMS